LSSASSTVRVSFACSPAVNFEAPPIRSTAAAASVASRMTRDPSKLLVIF